MIASPCTSCGDRAWSVIRARVLCGSCNTARLRERSRLHRANKDGAVTPVLGTLLMLALMMTLLPGFIAMKQEWSAVQESQIDAARAERERAETAAWCARHPDTGMPTCPDDEPFPGYSCARDAAGVRIVCTPDEGAIAPPTPAWG